jgi:hypothetical protein
VQPAKFAEDHFRNPPRRTRLAATHEAVDTPPDKDDTATKDLVMPFPIGGPASASWREQALARAAEYRFLARLLLPRGNERERQALLAIERHLFAAEDAAIGSSKCWDGRSESGERKKLGRWSRLVSFVTGAGVERANSQLDAVETDLLRLAPDPYLRGQMPNLVAHVRAHLPPNDPRRLRVEAISGAITKGRMLSNLERDQILGAVRAASLEARREIRRVRSFRNVLLVSAFILCLGVAGITVLAVTSPGRVPMCFAPDNTMVVCPTAAKPVEGAESTQTQSLSAHQQVGIDNLVRDTASRWDVPIVEIVGLLAAGLAGAFALRSIQGTSTPYSLPVAVAVLKLPTGALTAVFGLLLMRGGFIPGLSALDSSAQIIAWAIIFGYAQQLVTRLVDRQAHTVLEAVDSPPHPQLGTPSAPPSPQTPAGMPA